MVDQGLDVSTLKDLEHTIQQVDGVIAMHQLRTRSMGGQIYTDVHILVNPTISVSEGHYIADQVHQTLRLKFPEIKDIIVHVDPEDDEIIPRPSNLPSRSALNALLYTAWHDLPGYDTKKWLNCHYLNQTIRLSIALPLHAYLTMPDVQEHYQQRLAALLPVSSLSIYFYSD